MPRVRVFAICLCLIVGAQASTAYAGQSASPRAEPMVSPENTDAWWTSWSSCSITPVRIGDPPEGNGGRPEAIPWLLVSPSNASANILTITLFSGNRPLPVGGRFTDGSQAKWLWQFNAAGGTLNVEAINEHAARFSLTHLGPVNTPDSSMDWSSLIELPEPGCWRFSVEATSTTGDVFIGGFTFVAVP